MIPKKSDYTKYRLEIGGTEIRLEIGGTEIPDLSDNAHRIALYQRQPSGEWRRIVCYCYADADLALDELRLMIGKYRRAGIPVEHNLGSVRIEETVALPQREVGYVQ